MKRTLTTLSTLAMATIATAAADTVYQNEFDDYTNGYTSTSSADSEDKTIDLSTLDLNTTNGFTISINICGSDTSSNTTWARYLSISIDDSTTNGAGYSYLTFVGADTTNGTTGTGLFTAENSVNLPIFEETSGSTLDNLLNTGLSAIDAGTWYNVVLAVESDVWTLSVYDAEGSALYTMIGYDPDESYVGDLTALYVGGLVSDYDKSGALVDNIAVFDTVLSVDEQIELSVSTLSGNGIPTVPEPSTATLSLLALAGLCARRRRK